VTNFNDELKLKELEQIKKKTEKELKGLILQESDFINNPKEVEQILKEALNDYFDYIANNNEDKIEEISSEYSSEHEYCRFAKKSAEVYLIFKGEKNKQIERVDFNYLLFTELEKNVHKSREELEQRLFQKETFKEEITKIIGDYFDYVEKDNINYELEYDISNFDFGFEKRDVLLVQSPKAYMTASVYWIDDDFKLEFVLFETIEQLIKRRKERIEIQEDFAISSEDDLI